MVFEIASKSFELKKMNLLIRKLYQELVELLNCLSDLLDEVGKSDNEIPRKVFLEKNTELTKKIVEKREELLVAILERNGYNYDAKFWLKYADVEDLNDFIISAMSINSKSSNKKK